MDTEVTSRASQPNDLIAFARLCCPSLSFSLSLLLADICHKNANEKPLENRGKYRGVFGVEEARMK